MVNEKVSLIIPCYNIESSSNNSFDDTINSIINQTFGFENIELMFVDDCSSDKTWDLLKDYSERYVNVKIWSTMENTGGPSIPRNIGIKNASTEYILFLDQDDILLPETVNELYSKISTNNCDFVKINFNIVSNGNIHRHNTGTKKDIIIKPYSSDFQYCSQYYIWDGIYSRSFLMENDIFFENVRGEDFLFMINCICKTNKEVISLNSKEGVNYNADNQNSIMHNCFNEYNLKQLIYVSSKALSLIKSSPFDEKYLIFISSCSKFSAMVYLFYNSGDGKEIIYQLLYSFIKDYSKYGFIKIHEITYLHFLYWKVVYTLIRYDMKFLLFLLIDFTKKFKQTDRN